VAFLQIVKGSRPGQILELRGERMVLGRHPSCEIVLDNAAISRQHAQITIRHGSYFIEDLRSRNRTYVNGTPIDERTVLADSDHVKICDVVLQFFSAQQPPEPPTKEDSAPTLAGDRKTMLDMNAQDDEDLVQSSIITTLNAKNAATQRLGVKPEAKLRAILEISNSLARTLKLDDVLQGLLDGLFKVFPHADTGFVVLADREDGKRLVKASQARGGDATGSVRISNTIVKKVMESAEAILSADALEDSRFNASDSLDGLKIRSMICVPLLGQEGKPLGVIQLDTKSLRHQFNQTDLDVLVSVGAQASLAIENARLHEDLLQRSDIERELRFATQVQLGFLPEHRPSPPDYEFFDYYEPARRVGGDYFDYVPMPDGRIAIGLADVAGKGVPAALLMARLYSAVRLHLFTQPTPGKVLASLNEEILTQGMGHRFVTFVLLMLNPETHELTIANAGHLPPILRTPDGRSESIGRKESGMPLGIRSKQNYGELTIPVEPGTSLTVVTDGITEAMNPAHDLFGRVRLEELIAAHPVSAEQLVKMIVTEVDRFCGNRPQRDDMCVVCLRRSPDATDPAPEATTDMPSV
jgi:phosphoserine phosphatase RsbU/P